MDKWDLSRIYKDTASFEADLKRVKDDFIPKMASYEGKLSSPNSLHEYLALDRELKVYLINSSFIAHVYLTLIRKMSRMRLSFLKRKLSLRN